MHDSEQEHSGITGCRVTYESTIFYNEANKFSIIVVKTNDPRIPLQACSGRYYGDRMLRFTAVGYELPRTKAVELELDGEWVESKYGYQLQVEQWQEIVPQTADGLLAYLGSGLIKGIGPKTAEDIVATFGPDTLNILDNEPEKLLQIRGITEGKLKDIEESYAESRVLRNLMSLLGPFKITPATALKIYQHFGPACVDILKKCPYDLCQISGFGFKRVDGIVRKTDNRLHSAERIKGAVLYTLEDARSKSGHLFFPSEDLVKETLLLLNAPIPIPEQRVRAEEVQETLRQMILHGAVVAYKQYLYTALVKFGQDEYRQQFGFRSVEVRGHQFLINGEPFYFKGPCKHEDSAFRGRGYDACVTVTDLKLYQWLNANCLRMSHYPYAEEVYDLCDRLGIVVIDETPAVGIGAGAACDPYKTFPLKAYHSAVLRAMIDRDKNHPCVVLWSLGNEPDTEHFPQSAYDYWRPLYEQAHAQDPQDRPVTMVCCQNDYTRDITTRTMDVVCINRYYGWYNLSGDLENAAYAFQQELDFWAGIDKPLVLSEYGADTVAGLHGTAPEMFTEEFQVEYYKTINACLDSRPFVVGEWPWNFADFSTQQGPMRVGSCNRKGLFTRERTPKLAAHYFKDRWAKKQPNDR